MIKFITYSIFFVFINHSVFSQIEIAPISDNIAKVGDFYNLEVNNPSGKPYSFFIELEVRQSNQLIYQSRTNQYSIISPIAMLSESQLQPIQVLRNEIQKVEGEYRVDIRLVDQNTKQILFVDRFTFTSILNADDSKQKDVDLGFKYSGKANIYGQVSDMQGVGSFVPKNYVRAEIHPDFELGGIPIGVDVLLSTEQNAFRQSMNQVALRFDASQFKKSMQRRLQSKIKEIDAIGDLADVQNLSSLKEKAVAKKFPKLKEWEQQVNDPQIQKGLKDLKQLESIDKIIESAEVKDALAQKIKLETKKVLSDSESSQLKRLESFVSEIDKLSAKAETIKATAKQFEKYKDLNKKIVQAKRYANKDIVKDPAFFKDGMKSLNLMSKPQEFLNGFDAITIGTSYPYYSRLTMSSLSVNGLNIEWNPGKVYLAATYGLSSKMTYNTDFVNPQLTLPQTTLATKIGYGSPSQTHLHFTYIDISDRFEGRSLVNTTKPQSNRIIGTEGQLSLFSDRITIGGELNASLLTRDNTIETDNMQEFRKEEIPFNSILGNVNNSSSFDVAWRAFTDLKVFGDATKVKASMERVGANYYSLGAPTLLNDLLRWKAEVRQSFFKNKLSLSAYARQDANNLNPLLTSSSSITKSYGLSGSSNIPKWPSLTFSFAPYSQSSDIISTNEEFNTNATIFNLGLGYPFQLSKDINSFTQLTYLSQDLNSNISNIDYNLKTYSIAQSLTYKRNSLNISINYTPNQVINLQNKKVVAINANASAQLLKKLNTSIGYQYLSIFNQESRSGYFVTANYPITSFADFEVRLQRNIYSTQIDTDGYKDIVGWGGLKIRW